MTQVTCIDFPFYVTAHNALGQEVVNSLDTSQYIVSNYELHTSYIEITGQMAYLGKKTFTVQLVSLDAHGATHQMDLQKGVFTIAVRRLNNIFRVIHFNSSMIYGETKFPIDPRVLKSQVRYFADRLNSFYIGHGGIPPLRPLIGECLLQSEIYPAYLRQLHRFLEEYRPKCPSLFDLPTLDREDKRQTIRQLTHHMMSIHSECPNTFRRNHSTMIGLLRDCLSHCDGKEMEFLDAMIFWMFTKPVLDGERRKVLFDFLPDLRTYPPDDLAKELRHVTHDLTTHPDLIGSNIGVTEDQHGQGNIPIPTWVYERTIGEWGAQFIQMGHPCIAFASKYVPADEWIHFLKALKAQNQSFLYINFMRTKETTDSPQTEWMKTDLLHSLEATFDNFCIFSFDRHSAFYNQERSTLTVNAWLSMQESQFFKERLFAHLFSDAIKHPCRWSTRTTLDAAKQSIQTIIERVHAHYFGNSPQLSPSQRTIFYELVLLEYVESLLQKGNYRYFTTTCTTFSQGGASFAALLELKQLCKKGPLLSADIIRIIESVVGHGIACEYRGPSSPRIEVFLGTAKLIMRPAGQP